MALQTKEEAATKLTGRPGGGYPVAGTRAAIEANNKTSGAAGKPFVKEFATVRPGTTADPKITAAQRQRQIRQPGRKGSTGVSPLRNRKRTLV